MKVRELIALLQTMPQDLEVEINDEGGGEVYAVASAAEVFHYVPNKDLWPDDEESVIISVNGD